MLWTVYLKKEGANGIEIWIQINKKAPIGAGTIIGCYSLNLPLQDFFSLITIERERGKGRKEGGDRNADEETFNNLDHVKLQARS